LVGVLRFLLTYDLVCANILTMNSQPETVEGLTPRNIEEPSSRCNVCGSGLNSVESLVYGNRCLYCSPSVKNISFLKFIVNAVLDFLIYKKTLAWKSLTEDCPDCTSGKVKQIINNQESYVSDCCSCQGTGARSVGRLKFLAILELSGLRIGKN
jgi:hypothetical protein